MNAGMKMNACIMKTHSSICNILLANLLEFVGHVFSTFVMVSGEKQFLFRKAIYMMLEFHLRVKF